MGNIFFNEEKSLDFFDRIGATSKKLSDATNDLLSGTKAIIDNGDANVVANDIRKDSESAEGMMNDSSKIGKEFISNFFAEERSEANAIDGMSIPKDFVTENAAEVNYYNSVLLSKIDGKSVNEGHTTEKAKDIDDSSVVHEALTDINNNVTQEQTYDKSTSISGQSVLGNINGNTTQEKTYDDSSQISGKQLGDISGNTTSQQQFNNESTIVGQSILGNINAAGDTTKKDLDENDIVNAVFDARSFVEDNDEDEDEDEEEK